MTDDEPYEQTSTILSPQCYRDNESVTQTERAKTKQAVANISGAIYQGLGPDGLVIAISSKFSNSTKAVRRTLEDNGIVLENERLDSDLPWVGIPKHHTLYYIKETPFN